MRITLTAADWDKRLGGWKSDALRLPGAALKALYYDNKQADPRRFSVGDGLVLWAAPDVPREIVIEIELTKDLSGIEDRKIALEKEKLGLEQEKLGLEHEKFKLDRRWKLLAPVGAIGVAALSFGSAWFLQERKLNSDETRAGAVVPPVAAPMVSQLPKESSDKDFDLLRDISVFDLRSWRPVPPERRNARTSPVNYINYLHLRKKTDAASYVAHYSTTGYAIDLRCITHRAKVVRTTSQDHPHETSYSIDVDVGDEPANSELLLVIEATYWNGFSNPKESDAATYTAKDSAPLGELALVVLFPEAKPFKSYKTVTKVPTERDYSPFIGSSRLYADASNHFVYWSIQDKKPDTHYKLDWTW